MCHDAGGSHQVATTPTQSRGNTYCAQADFFQPFAGKGGCQPKKNNGYCKDTDHFAEAPVFSRAGDSTVHLGEGRFINASYINRTDAEMDGDRSEEHAPAVIACGRDDAFLAEKIRDKNSLVVIGLLPLKIEEGKAAIIYSI